MLARRLEWGLLPAVPVPFRGDVLDGEAQQRYAEWMAGMPVSGVAVWAHTGRGPHLSPTQRALIIRSWREAMPDRTIVAGARDDAMAAEAQRGGADALLAFPVPDDPVGHHRRLGRRLPVIAFLLYDAAGGVSYDDTTLHALLELPEVIGIKVATLDSVMTFQRVAAVCRSHPDKLLITGEDRFLGYSLMCGARGALVGMGAALPDLQADLLRARAVEDWTRFAALSDVCDAFSQVTFVGPMEGYIRRMLWAVAAEGVIPIEACDDPWGPRLPDRERVAVERMVRGARAARG